MTTGNQLILGIISLIIFIITFFIITKLKSNDNYNLLFKLTAASSLLGSIINIFKLSSLMYNILLVLLGMTILYTISSLLIIFTKVKKITYISITTFYLLIILFFEVFEQPSRLLLVIYVILIILICLFNIIKNKKRNNYYLISLIIELISSIPLYIKYSFKILNSNSITLLITLIAIIIFYIGRKKGLENNL